MGFVFQITALTNVVSYHYPHPPGPIGTTPQNNRLCHLLLPPSGEFFVSLVAFAVKKQKTLTEVDHEITRSDFTLWSSKKKTLREIPEDLSRDFSLERSGGNESGLGRRNK